MAGYRNEVDYNARLRSPQARDVMIQMAKTAEEQGRDFVPQSWARDARFHQRPVPAQLIRDLVRAGFIRSKFTNGPIYQIVLWPKPEEDVKSDGE